MIHFHNPTPLDPRGFTITGLSAKNDDNAIGQFGTGLKYAIAFILRSGGKIEIQTQGETYKFSVEQGKLRNTEYHLVHCNGEPLSFTTDFGPNWEAWMAYRELFCNATDEGGGVSRTPVEDITVITVKCKAVEAIALEHDKYFIHPQSARYRLVESLPGLEVYHRGQELSTPIFYKGVYVGDTDKKLTHIYNLTGTHDGLLSEERQANVYSFTGEVNEILQKHATPLTLAAFKLRMGEELTYRGYSLGQTSQSLLTFCEELHQAQRCPKALQRLYAESTGRPLPVPTFEPSPLQQQMLKRAVEFLAAENIRIDPSEIVFATTTEDKVFGFVENRKIHLTQKAFEHGTFDLAATLLEEHLHLTRNFADETRQFQDHLLRTVISLMQEKNNILL